MADDGSQHKAGSLGIFLTTVPLTGPIDFHLVSFLGSTWLTRFSLDADVKQAVTSGLQAIDVNSFDTRIPILVPR